MQSAETPNHRGNRYVVSGVEKVIISFTVVTDIEVRPDSCAIVASHSGEIHRSAQCSIVLSNPLLTPRVEDGIHYARESR